MQTSNYKSIKSHARFSLKKHYLIFIAACLFAALLGSNYQESLTLMSARLIGAEKTPLDNLRISGYAEVYDQFLRGNPQSGENIAEELEKEKTQKEQKIGPVELALQRGVLANIVNKISSGELLVTAFVAFQSIASSAKAANILLIVCSLFLMLSFQIFLVNVYKIIYRRIFMEGYLYEKIPYSRFLHLLRMKSWFHSALVMMYASLFEILWTCTIIGGVIKHYSYILIPNIIAENPSIPAKDALKLSEDMMEGHKWECFLLQFSFIGWNLLGFATFGLTNLLFANAYKEAAYCEYYVLLRKEAKEKQLKNNTSLNDTYLYQKAIPALLIHTYEERNDLGNAPSYTQRTGLAGIAESWFGIVLRYDEQEYFYRKYAAWNARYVSMQAILEGKQYPPRLNPSEEQDSFYKDSFRKIDQTHYLRHYSLVSLILIFFSLSFAGWIWEVSLHILTDGEFINRGVLHGPWLPIYGCGSLLILSLLHKFRGSPLKEFTAILLLCGTIEYSTSWYMEMIYHEKWWDYTGYFLNINGRICAEGLLVFGIGGLAIVYFLAPSIDNFLLKIPQRSLAILCLVLCFLFTTDTRYSLKHPNKGEGITNYSLQITKNHYIKKG